MMTTNPHHPPLTPRQVEAAAALRPFRPATRGTLWTDGVYLSFTPSRDAQPARTEMLGGLTWHYSVNGGVIMRFERTGFWQLGISVHEAAWWRGLAAPLGVSRPLLPPGLPHRWGQTRHQMLGATYKPVTPPRGVLGGAAVEVQEAPDGLPLGAHRISVTGSRILLTDERDGLTHHAGHTHPAIARARGRTITISQPGRDRLVVTFAGPGSSLGRRRLRGSHFADDPFIEWLRILNDARSLWLPRRVRLAIGVRSPEIQVYVAARAVDDVNGAA